jgi:hypothetical protein
VLPAPDEIALPSCLGTMLSLEFERMVETLDET